MICQNYHSWLKTVKEVQDSRVDFDTILKEVTQISTARQMLEETVQSTPQTPQVEFDAVAPSLQ